MANPETFGAEFLVSSGDSWVAAGSVATRQTDYTEAKLQMGMSVDYFEASDYWLATGVHLDIY